MKNLSGDLTGQHSWLLSKIFLEITHQENIIAYGNTLTNPAFANGIDGKDSFDFIIANPPFGVDWKHNYDDVLENMQSKKSNFFVVRDEKNRVVTPKKSDGQFLFMMHIINLMKQEEKKGKRAKADTKKESLFSPHPYPKDKMKNAYSKENIKNLKRYLSYKKDYKYIAKAISCDRDEINISNEIGFKDESEDLRIDALLDELDGLMKEMCDEYQNNGLIGLK